MSGIRTLLMIIMTSMTTSAWWALAMFGFPDKVDGATTVNAHMVPVVMCAITGSIAIIVWLVYHAIVDSDD